MDNLLYIMAINPHVVVMTNRKFEGFMISFTYSSVQPINMHWQFSKIDV